MKKTYAGKVPKINWILFDKSNPPTDLSIESEYLVLLREDEHNDGATWLYSIDTATAYGSYIDEFWNTEKDWVEGQRVEVIAYAKLPYALKESELIDGKE